MADTADTTYSCAAYAGYKSPKALGRLEGAVVRVCSLGGGTGWAWTGDPRVATRCFENFWVPDTQERPDNWWAHAPIIPGDDIEWFCEQLRADGAEVLVQTAAPGPVRVEADGFLIRLHCNPGAEPGHFVLRLEDGPVFRWHGTYPYGVRRAIPWNGRIITTRQGWKEHWKPFLEEIGIPWVGDNPEAAPPRQARELARDAIPGWAKAAPNGKTLHRYQREGVEFVARCGGRALIGDEMGTGKTALSIAAAVGMGVARTLVIAPVNARYVWEREIHAWTGDTAIQHVTAQDDAIDPAARWTIVTYDLLAVRARKIRVKKRDDVQLIRKALRNANVAYKEEIHTEGGWTIAIAQPAAVAGLSPELQLTWDRMIERLDHQLLRRLWAWAPDLVIADEAHRVKNPGSKRTKSVQTLLDRAEAALALTGTPLRNRVDEVGTLLCLLDPQAREQLNLLVARERGPSRRVISERLVQEFLRAIMIRRRKKDVLPQLPPKIRSWIPVVPDRFHPEIGALVSEYHAAMGAAEYVYWSTIARGDTVDQARQAALGCIEKARVQVGLIKIVDGQVADGIAEVVQQKGSCIVFCAHHAVTDRLRTQLEALRMRVVVVDGRHKASDRAAAARAFQAGEADIFLAGIHAAGEAIDLSSASDCVFVEADWTPGAMQQAEDRGHRLGQAGRGYHIYHHFLLMEGVELDQDLRGLLERKIELIDRTLREKTDFSFVESQFAGNSVRGLLLDRVLCRGPQVDQGETRLSFGSLFTARH